MKRIWFGLGLCLFGWPWLGLAQRPAGPGTGLNLARIQTVTGTISAARPGYGVEYPTVTLQQVTIKTAPIWFFQNHDFEVKAGDPVRVLAAPANAGPGNRRADPYLHAIEISNTATGATLRLRDSSGLPLWSGMRSARAQGSRVMPRCATTPVTVSGTIESVTAGAGIQMPVLILQTADGQLLTIKIGPERILLAADLELRPGDPVTVVYAADCLGEAIALQITNSAGVTVMLRDELGRPAWPE